MKKMIGLVFFLSLLAIPSVQAVALTFTVATDPLWTDTGLLLNAGETVTLFGATGTVTWATWSGRSSGPEGDPQPTLTWDEWITNGRHGQLIGFVGADPGGIAQNDSRLFEIGNGSVTKSGVSGKLWLGFNDDYTHPDSWNADNLGAITVNMDGPRTTVDGVPEPLTLLLLGSGVALLFGLRKRYVA